MASLSLDGALLRAGSSTYLLAKGEVSEFDPVKNEARGTFELRPGMVLQRGHTGLVIEASYHLTIRLLSSVIGSDGMRRYRFTANCAPDMVDMLDMTINPVRHPTVLEQMMH
jgi:hypothetical protein